MLYFFCLYLLALFMLDLDTLRKAGVAKDLFANRTENIVARRLAVSPRTLQRRLKEEGLTYKAIIEDLRKEFAISYMQQPNLSVSEIAFLLSYADASAFIRSFKRWEGASPASWRENQIVNA